MAACDSLSHVPVMCEQVIAAWLSDPAGWYVDTTFGRGGHTRALLAHLHADAKVWVVDHDPQAYAVAKALAQVDERVQACHARFDQLLHLAQLHGFLGRIVGILFDLGVSSPQLEDPQRGLSFRRAGPLDMRMDPSRGLPLHRRLQGVRVEEVRRVLRQYGDEPRAHAIAQAIVRDAQAGALQTTLDLARCVQSVCPRGPHRIHPATRTFQALRIWVNDEQHVLDRTLPHTLHVLRPGGRLVCVSFHSGEDRLVKHFMRQHAHDPRYPAGLPVRASVLQPALRQVGGLVRPDPAECVRNPRSRSARMRVAERCEQRW